MESLVNYLKNTKRLENVDATKISLKHGQSFHNHCQNNLEHLTYCAVLFYFLFVESIEKYQTIHKKKRTPEPLSFFYSKSTLFLGGEGDG